VAGRIRTIKPEILSDAKAARLSDRAWRLWVSMWTLADDCGLCPSDPDFLGARVFWGTGNTDAREALGELVQRGFISLYIAKDEAFAKINGWSTHQKIDKPSGARFPTPPETFPALADISRAFAKPREDSGRDHDHDHDPDQDHIPDSPPAPRDDFDFDAVYALYPRKEGKKKGLQRCRSQIKSRLKYDALLQAVKNYAAVASPGYEKHFDTFMGCWEDYADAGLLTPRQPTSHRNAPLPPCPADLESKTEPLP
jgi:hypothetical protein